MNLIIFRSENPLHESQYRSRRPHPCYRRHVRLEQEATKLQTKYPHYIRTIIICPGVTFGRGEDTLHYFFKLAFLNKHNIPIYTPGTNNIPLLHVNDLGIIVRKVVLELPQMPDDIRYIFAANNQINYQEFVKRACKMICGPECRLLIKSKEEMYLIDESLIPVRN